MCVFDETGAKSLLDDEIFVATGRTPLSAKVFGDVGGRFQARSAFQRAFVSVCLRDGSAYAGRRNGEISGSLEGGTALRTRDADGVERPERRVRRRRRAANVRRDGLARASVAWTRALAL